MAVTLISALVYDVYVLCCFRLAPGRTWDTTAGSAMIAPSSAVWTDNKVSLWDTVRVRLKQKKLLATAG